MTGFSRFNKQWASTGAILNPTDSQANAGFAFLGATPPSVELFNSLMQALDDKDNVLYNWIAAVLVSAGITPADATPSQLLNAIKAVVGPGRMLNRMIYTASATYTPSAGTRLVNIDVVGGGGGGGGANNTGANSVSAGAGGGAGGYASKLVAVSVIGSSQPVTIGAPGTAGTPTVSAGSGGTTSVGAIVSATGGGGGEQGPSFATTNVFPWGRGASGFGIGGDIIAPGGIGAYAFYPGGTTPLGGKGGISFLGDGGGHVIGSSNGNAAGSFGAGGGGGCQGSPSSGGATGGAAGGGWCCITEYS